MQPYQTCARFHLRLLRLNTQLCSKNRKTETRMRHQNWLPHLGSGCRPPRARCCRRSGPAVPARLRQRRSRAWACPVPPRFPRRCPSPPPARTSPCAAPCRGKLPGSSKWTGSACRTPSDGKRAWALQKVTTRHAGEKDKSQSVYCTLFFGCNGNKTQKNLRRRADECWPNQRQNKT